MAGESLGMIETKGLVGAVAANVVSEVVSIHVVPRPHSEVEMILPNLD